MAQGRTPHSRLQTAARFARRAAPALVLIFIACPLALLYVGAEDQIYYWDFGGYFKRFQYLGDAAAAGQFSIREVIWNIRHEDYNFAPVLALVPAHLLFGGAREVYVCAVLILYWLPACLLAASLADYARTGQARPPHKLPLWLLAAAALYWPFLSTVMRGFPDIAGLIPFGLACLLIVRPDLLRARPILRGLALGLLVWATFALRRWYAYSCVSLLLVAGLVALWAVWRSDDRPAALRGAVLEYGTCGLTLLALLALQWPLVSRILATSYASAFADYQRPFPQHLIIVYDQIGPLITLATTAGIVRAVRERNRTLILLSAVAIISFIFFCLTQAPSMQHTLPWMFLLFPAFVAGLTWPVKTSLPRRRIWAATAWMAVSTAFVLWPAATHTLGFARIALPSFTYPPMQVQNVDQYRALAADLSARLQPGDRVAVYAWTREVSTAMLEAIDPTLAPHAFHVGVLDRRDGFRTEGLTADYVVVMAAPSGQPRQTRKVPTHVTAIPTALIRAGRGIGAAYRQVSGPYTLSSCAFQTVELRCTPDTPAPQAFLYQRTRPVTAAEARDLRARLLALYPDWVDRADGYGPP